MNLKKSQIHIAMRSMVQKCGCLESVSEITNTSVSIVSKKMNGVLNWTISDVMHLEEALGIYPITRIMSRINANDQIKSNLELPEIAGQIAKDTGSAVQSILSVGPKVDRKAQHACSMVEIDQALVALKQARTAIETLYNEGAG